MRIYVFGNTAFKNNCASTSAIVSYVIPVKGAHDVDKFNVETYAVRGPVPWSAINKVG